MSREVTPGAAAALPGIDMQRRAFIVRGLLTLRIQLLRQETQR